MPSEKIAGTAYIKYDGAQLSLSGTLTVSLDTVEREGLAGLSGPAGYKETPRVPFIEAEVFGDSDWDPAALDLITDATIVAELANGKKGVLRNAWKAGASDFNAAEGTTTVRFEGMSGEWDE